MISYIKGKYSNGSIITNSGLGYKILLSKEFAENSEIELYISTVYRENAILLYGFEDTQSLSLFESLIKINGIGPQTAYNILSSYPTFDIYQAIESKNIVFLSKIKGLGSKSVNRIISDVKLPVLHFDNKSVTNKYEIISLLSDLGFEKNKVISVLSEINSDDEKIIISTALSKLRSNL